MIATRLWRNPAFRFGLALRLLAVFFVAPYVQSIWFVPFMRHAIEFPGLDPWSSFLSLGGDPMAFPYGVAMFFCHLPFVAVGMLAQWLTGIPSLAQTGFALSLLTADFCLLLTLCRLNKDHTDDLVIFYWLSPVVLYVNFWHGQTDIIPMLLIVSTLMLIRERRFGWAGAIYALAIAAKFSAALPLPFILIFLWKNRRNRAGLLRFSVVGAALSIAIHVPLLFSPGFRSMVLGSPEVARLYEMSIALSAGTNIYIVPVVYLLLLFWAWQIGRMSFEMLFAFLGVSYFLILLATPAAVGWFLWVIPFLATFQIVSGRGPRWLIAGFSVALVAIKALTSTGSVIPILGVDLHMPLLTIWAAFLTPREISLVISGITAVGLVICVTMVQRALMNNDFFRLSRRPLIIGIAGDSGTGKDTLSLILMGLFGEHSSAAVSGDDYHRFERASPMWRTLTHLDPRANDLRTFASDCLALVNGERVLYRHYDHSTGRFSRRHVHSSKDVILVSGLHALYPEDLRTRMDVRIFLDMDDDLRLFLKMRRDVRVRGHSPEQVLKFIEHRRADRDRYIQPQIQHADVVFSLRAESQDQLRDIMSDLPVRLLLQVKLRTLLRCDELAQALVSLCGIQAEVVPASDQSTTQIIIIGDEISADDVKETAEYLVPHLDELLDENPEWKAGMTGIMQIVVLMLIAEKARNRD